MLGFVLSCHKMDDNYDQHTCDSPASTGSPCVKQKFTIHKSAQSFGNGYNHKTIVLFTCSFALPQLILLAYHDEGDLHKRLESEKGAWRNNYECVPQHLLHLGQMP